MLKLLASRALVIAAMSAAAAGAQDVQYTTITKVDLGGGMNAIMRMAGASEVKETAYIKGKKLWPLAADARDVGQSDDRDSRRAHDVTPRVDVRHPGWLSRGSRDLAALGTPA